MALLYTSKTNMQQLAILWDQYLTGGSTPLTLPPTTVAEQITNEKLIDVLERLDRINGPTMADVYRAQNVIT